MKSKAISDIPVDFDAPSAFLSSTEPNDTEKARKRYQADFLAEHYQLLRNLKPFVHQISENAPVLKVLNKNYNSVLVVGPDFMYKKDVASQNVFRNLMIGLHMGLDRLLQQKVKEVRIEVWNGRFQQFLLKELNAGIKSMKYLDDADAKNVDLILPLLVKLSALQFNVVKLSEIAQALQTKLSISKGTSYDRFAAAKKAESDSEESAQPATQLSQAKPIDRGEEAVQKVRKQRAADAAAQEIAAEKAQPPTTSAKAASQKGTSDEVQQEQQLDLSPARDNQTPYMYRIEIHHAFTRGDIKELRAFFEKLNAEVAVERIYNKNANVDKK